MAATASSSDDLATRICRNDPELQHLYLSSDSLSPRGVTLLVDALSRQHATKSSSSSSHDNNNNNRHLHHVYFRNFKTMNGSGILERLLQAVSGLEGLQSLFFHCTEVPVPILTQLLLSSSSSSRGNCLTALGLRYCKLRYTQEEDCHKLEAALREHASLEDICLECCEWQADEDGPNHNHNDNQNNDNHHVNKLDAWVQAMAQIPTLRHVECVVAATASSSNAARPVKLAPASLKALSRVPSLTSLRLRNLALSQEDVALVCHCLLQQQQQQQQPCCEKPPDKISKRPSLKKLILSCDLGGTSALALAKLVSESSLVHLSLRVDHLLDVDCPKRIARALQKSSTVQHFHLSGKCARTMSPVAKTAFCDMMQTNVVLEFVRLEVADYTLQTQIAFYLQLNHKGRRELFGAIHQEELFGNNNSNKCRDEKNQQQQQQKQQQQQLLWMDCLCQNSTDVQALYYFITLHPALYATAALAAMNSPEAAAAAAATIAQRHTSQLEIEAGIEYDSEGW
jgi:hypothetical protein